MVAPSRRKEMAQKAVQYRGVSIRLACQAFGISQRCYYYQAKGREENELIADWLLKLHQHLQTSNNFHITILRLLHKSS